MTTAVLIEARLSAHADLLLHPLGGRTGLARCIHRAARIPGADAVLVTVGAGESGDALSAEATANGAIVTRDGEDGLARAAGAIKAIAATQVIAVRADQPFLDPIIAMGVKALLTDAKADFACNTMPAGFPDGLDCAAFSAALLMDAEARARHASERRDTTAWMKSHPGLVKANLNGPGGALAALRWRLSSQADLNFATSVFDEMGETAAHASAAELAALALRRPDLAELNAASINLHRNDGTHASLQSRPVQLGLAA